MTCYINPDFHGFKEAVYPLSYRAFVYFVFFVERSRSVARRENELYKHTSLAPCTTSLHHFSIDMDEIDIDEYPKAYLMDKIESDLSFLDQNKML